MNGPLSQSSLEHGNNDRDLGSKHQLAAVDVTSGLCHAESAAHLSHIENGRKVVSPERAARWASLLGYAESQFVRLALSEGARPRN
jgi:transcriptional regulator with XRE-family HTH domain